MQKELCTAHQKRRRIFIIYAPQCSLQMVVIIKVVIWHFSLSVDCPLLRAKAWPPPLFRTGEAAEAEAVGPFCQSSSPAVWGPDRAVLLWIAQLATQRAYLTPLPLCHHNTMLQRPLSRMLVGACVCQQMTGGHEFGKVGAQILRSVSHTSNASDCMSTV